MTQQEAQDILDKLKSGKYYVRPGFRNYTGDYTVIVVFYDKNESCFYWQTYNCHGNGDELVRHEKMSEEQALNYFQSSKYEQTLARLSTKPSFTYCM